MPTPRTYQSHANTSNFSKSCRVLKRFKPLLTPRTFQNDEKHINHCEALLTAQTFRRHGNMQELKAAAAPQTFQSHANTSNMTELC